MLYILTQERTAPDHFRDVVDSYAFSARPRTVNSTGDFHYAWTSEFGTGNTIVHLQGLSDPCAYETTTYPGGDGANHGHIMAVDRQLLLPIRELRSDLDVDAGICELRIYDIMPGRVNAFVDAMLRFLPLRERYSANLGVWQPLTGHTSRLVHIWYYKNAQDRVAARAAVGREAQWQEYRGTVLPLVANVYSSILSPIPITRQP